MTLSWPFVLVLRPARATRSFCVASRSKKTLDEGVAVELSRGASDVAFSWNVNALMTFVYARDGVLTRQFEPLLYDGGSDAEQTLPEERDLPFPRDDSSAPTPRRAALAPRPTFRRAVGNVNEAPYPL